MKYILFLLLLISNLSYGQKSLVKGETYAVIVGISSYADDNIPDLRFAHKDADEFRKYLLSSAGGKVPPEHIKFLSNDDATISNVYTAMKWLEDQVMKDDLVYFYFSGHGDIEKGLYKLGFLIAHDTPNLNYINNAIRIEDVNIMANNLSATKEAKVIMITDACHSGKLSGSDNTRSMSLGELLTKVEDNEIRIASCKPNQLSKEDAVWGGGRGVFSYYLINGLKGLADKDGNDNKEVTIGELNDYLTTNVKRDVKRIKRAKQTPVIHSKSEKKKVAFVNEDILRSLIGSNPDETQATMDGNKSIGGEASLQDLYFKELSKVDLKNEFDFREWAQLNNDEIVEKVLTRFDFDNIIGVDASKWRDDIRNDIRLRNSYKLQLASAIHNEVQKTINAYLIGDRDEMERRKYYNVNESDFDEYVFMLDIAMELISPNDYLYDMMEIKKHYFAGIAARLKVGYSNNIDSLIDIGMAEQQKALKLDNKAAYIHNEIGLLYRLRQDNESAIKKFETAREIAPNWAIPVSNLGNAYLSLKDYDKGFEMANMAVKMQPDYVNAKICLGRNSIKLNNYLLAEDILLKAAKLNDLSYESREELGALYGTTIRYKDANRYYQEAYEIRNEIVYPFNPMIMDTDADGVIDITDGVTVEANKNVIIMDSTILFNNPTLHFNYAMNSYENSDFETAFRYLKKTIILSDADPLAYFYLGNIYFKWKDTIAAEICYKKAIENRRSLEGITEYLNSFSSPGNAKNIYKNYTFSMDRLYFNLSNIYREMNYNVQTEDMYWKLINSYKQQSKETLLFYRLLWELKNEQKLYSEVESLINEYRSFNATHGLDELYTFYYKMLESDSNRDQYRYKMALLGYEDFKFGKKEKYWSRYSSGDDSEDDFLITTDWGSRKIHYASLDTTIYYLDAVNLSTGNTISDFQSIEEKTDTLMLKDIYAKLAELYKDQGNMDASKKYYSLALDYGSDNASLVEDMISIQIIKQEYQSAYELLDDAYQRKELYYKDLVTYSEYSMLSGEYAEGEAVVDAIRNVLPIDNQRLVRASALKHLLNEDYDSALSMYRSIYDSGDTSMDITYTISRLQSQLDNMEEAEKYLMEVEGKGFDYYWVLKNDPMMMTMKDTEIYKLILSKNEPVR